MKETTEWDKIEDMKRRPAATVAKLPEVREFLNVA